MRHRQVWRALLCYFVSSSLSCVLPGSLLPVEGADTIIIGGETRVIDGDTLEVKGERVRLEGIDAPEKGQSCRNASGELYPCGQAVIYALHGRIGKGNVVCAIDAARDRYGRALGVCSLGGEDLNAWLVSEGHALAYRRYSLKYVEQGGGSPGSPAGDLGGRLRSALGLAARRAAGGDVAGWRTRCSGSVRRQRQRPDYVQGSEGARHRAGGQRPSGVSVYGRPGRRRRGL